MALMISHQLTCFQLARSYKFGLEGHSSLPKISQRSTPASILWHLLPSIFYPAAEGEAGHHYPLTALPRGTSPGTRHPKAGLWVYGEQLGLAESGGRRKAAPPRQGKAGLKHERALSRATAPLG